MIKELSNEEIAIKIAHDLITRLTQIDAQSIKPAKKLIRMNQAKNIAATQLASVNH